MRRQPERQRRDAGQYLPTATTNKTLLTSVNFIVSVKDKILFRAFKIAIIAALAREVCGAIPVLNFAGDIFATASTGTNFVLTPNQQAMMLGLIQVAGSMLGSSVVEKAGRKVRDDSVNFEYNVKEFGWKCVKVPG